MNRALTLVLAVAMVATLAFVPGAAAADAPADTSSEPAPDTQSLSIDFDDGTAFGPIVEWRVDRPPLKGCVTGASCVGK